MSLLLLFSGSVSAITLTNPDPDNLVFVRFRDKRAFVKERDKRATVKARDKRAVVEK